MRNKVLIVDDESMICEVGVEMFDMLGYEAFSAETLEAAVEVWKVNHADIGLVILDLNLRGVTGIEVFTALKEIDGSINGALASGEFIESDAPKFKALGFIDILLKPYKLNTLQELCGKYLEG
ncbi:MAG: response regulator [Candidatus Cloacimonetes bacterium]|nr:response regulator [Candidatus Cloacimonadota bacterium]